VDEIRCRSYIKQLFEAVNHCHAQKIVHRDIKPENVMITSDDLVKLIDFGLAEWAVGEIEQAAGSMFYYAPETFKKKSVAQSDIWSVGVTMYKVLTGVLPFDGETRGEVEGKIMIAAYDVENEKYKELSEECRDLLS